MMCLSIDDSRSPPPISFSYKCIMVFYTFLDIYLQNYLVLYTFMIYDTITMLIISF